MRQNHSIFELRLLPYVYETLNARECRDLEGHIRGCLRCQKVIERLLNLKKKMETEPKPSIQGLWNSVAQAIRHAGRSAGRRAGRTHPGSSVSEMLSGLAQRLGKRMLTAVMATAAVAAAAVVVVTLTLQNAAAGRIRILKVSGDVTVNSRPFFRNVRSDYPLSGTLNLGTRDGECVVQLAREGILAVSENTDVTLEKGRDHTIALKKGLIIVRIDRSSQKTEFRVRTPKGEFTAKSAVFYVRTDGGAVECGVKEGELRTVVNGRFYEVTGSAKIRLGEGETLQTALTGKDHDFFDILEGYGRL